MSKMCLKLKKRKSKKGAYNHLVHLWPSIILSTQIRLLLLFKPTFLTVALLAFRLQLVITILTKNLFYSLSVIFQSRMFYQCFDSENWVSRDVGWLNNSAPPKFAPTDMVKSMWMWRLSQKLQIFKVSKEGVLSISSTRNVQKSSPCVCTACKCEF